MVPEMLSSFMHMLVPISPFIGGLLAVSLFRKHKLLASVVAIGGVGLSLLLSCWMAWEVLAKGQVLEGVWYTWLWMGSVPIEIGYLVDSLTIIMMILVTAVSFAVHLYAVGYMQEDSGYVRFFCYISLFTFSMLMLVMSNNLVQMFFGWEGVGLMSYLLIGFWYHKPSAIKANLKAFLVNRVGDLAFIVGIGLIFAHTSALSFAGIEAYVADPSTLAGPLSLACLLLFIGAMGKSAQFPLHIWLPDSMEGPTPISALIHAATMVTAGIFMVSRLAFLFELSEWVSSIILVVGAITALLVGCLGLVQNDIKRVIAYSTVSQLGYMVMALGVSAYPLAVFHLLTHGFFKALLFLAAGSVIIGMHHVQDIRKMSGLGKQMPFTRWVFLAGALSLVGFPLFSGFYSKDLILEAIKHSAIFGAGFAFYAALAGVFFTAFYTFRVYFRIFHGKPISEAVLRVPATMQIALAVLLPFAVVSGYLLVNDFVSGNLFVELPAMFNTASMVDIRAWFEGPVEMLYHVIHNPAFYLTILGIFTALVFYVLVPNVAAYCAGCSGLAIFRHVLNNKYYLDILNERLLLPIVRTVGRFLWFVGDVLLINGAVIGSLVWFCRKGACLFSKLQNGLIRHYLLFSVMVFCAILSWRVFGG